MRLSAMTDPLMLRCVRAGSFKNQDGSDAPYKCLVLEDSQAYQTLIWLRGEDMFIADALKLNAWYQIPVTISEGKNGKTYLNIAGDPVECKG